MTDLKSLIAKARAEVANSEPEIVPVEVGGELVDVAVRPVAGYVWANLTATHPPRDNSAVDATVGFDSDAVAKDYPVEYITVAGEPIDQATWRELFDVLTASGIQSVAAALWAINQVLPAKRVMELGKARTSGRRKKRS
jgi:hypothetical protein